MLWWCSLRLVFRQVHHSCWAVIGYCGQPSHTALLHTLQDHLQEIMWCTGLSTKQIWGNCLLIRFLLRGFFRFVSGARVAADFCGNTGAATGTCITQRLHVHMHTHTHPHAHIHHTPLHLLTTTSWQHHYSREHIPWQLAYHKIWPGTLQLT